MISIRRFWQKSLKQIGWRLSLPRARALQRRLTGVRQENQALRLELEAVQDAIEAGMNRQAQSLSEMQEKLELLEEERNITAQQVEDLRGSLSAAVSRQETTEQQITSLEDTLQKTRASHRAEMQEADERLRRQARRGNVALLTAGLAILFAVVTTVTGIRDVRDNNRILADVSRDLRDIKQAMDEQLSGSHHESSLGDRVAETDAVANRKARPRGGAVPRIDEQPVAGLRPGKREAGVTTLD